MLSARLSFVGCGGNWSRAWMHTHPARGQGRLSRRSSGFSISGSAGMITVTFLWASVKSLAAGRASGSSGR